MFAAVRRGWAPVLYTKYFVSGFILFVAVWHLSRTGGCCLSCALSRCERATTDAFFHFLLAAVEPLLFRRCALLSLSFRKGFERKDLW